MRIIYIIVLALNIAGYSQAECAYVEESLQKVTRTINNLVKDYTKNIIQSDIDNIIHSHRRLQTVVKRALQYDFSKPYSGHTTASLLLYPYPKTTSYLTSYIREHGESYSEERNIARYANYLTKRHGVVARNSWLENLIYYSKMFAIVDIKNAASSFLFALKGNREGQKVSYSYLDAKAHRLLMASRIEGVGHYISTFKAVDNYVLSLIGRKLLLGSL